MDLSLIGAAAGAISAAKDIGKAALGIRDANLIAGEMAKLNDQLLAAQDALFRHNAQLLDLQQQHFDATMELQKLRERAAERARYVLGAVSAGAFAYRYQATDPDEAAAAPPHWLCQPCFDNGRKVVLSKIEVHRLPIWQCTVCKVGLRATLE